MNVERIAAFSHGGAGGNPAGVVIADSLPAPERMQRIAAEVGYSETAFAARIGDLWRVRYFAPEMEVPFCGHATIALGAALGARVGAGVHRLKLNDAEITVEATQDNSVWSATLSSPPTRNEALDPALLSGAMELLGLEASDLAGFATPARISAGADMVLIPLATRERLSRLDYDMETGARLLNAHGIVGVYLAHQAEETTWDVRLPFPTGGVFEDPATGAAAAAFSGWLRDTGRHTGEIAIRQGDDMGVPSRLKAVSTPEIGAPVKVSGATRRLA